MVLIGGLSFDQIYDGWLANRPADPLNQIAAAWHPYSAFGAAFGSAAESQPNFYPQVYDQVQAILDAGIPVVISEIGEPCTAGTPNAPEVTNVTTWADARHVSVLGWTWDNWSTAAPCNNMLIKDRTGTPTDGYGQAFHDWMVNHR